MGDSCRYLTLRILLCKQKERTTIGTLFSLNHLKYTLSVGSRPLISISAMDFSTLVGNHQFEVAFLQSPLAIPTNEGQIVCL